MFNITNYYRNATQNSNEVSPHSSQDGSSKNLQTNAGKGVENKGPSYTVGGNVNCYSFYAEWYVVVLFMTVIVYPWTVAPRFLSLWDFSGRNTAVGCHFLHQGIILSHGLNLHPQHPLHWQENSLPLSHLGSPHEECNRGSLKN